MTDRPRHILAATDLSRASEPALRQAAALAEALGAKVTLLHVFDPTPLVPPVALPPPRALEEKLAEEMRERIAKELHRLRERLLPPDLEVEEAVLRASSPAAAIIEQAEQRGADLIVLGTHGRTGLTHVLVGSVAERVVRHSPVPVLTVRAPAQD